MFISRFTTGETIATNNRTPERNTDLSNILPEIEETKQLRTAESQHLVLLEQLKFIRMEQQELLNKRLETQVERTPLFL